MRYHNAVNRVSSNLFQTFIRQIYSETDASLPSAVKKIVSIPDTEVGPGASKDSAYKNPEYYCYNNTSYFDAEMELSKYRLPQPSNKTPLKNK